MVSRLASNRRQGTARSLLEGVRHQGLRRSRDDDVPVARRERLRSFWESFRSIPEKKLSILRFAESGEGEISEELLVGLLCERFRCLPSELENEDIALLLRASEALSIFRAVEKAKTPESFKLLTKEEKRLLAEILKLEGENA